MVCGAAEVWAEIYRLALALPTKLTGWRLILFLIILSQFTLQQGSLEELVACPHPCGLSTDLFLRPYWSDREVFTVKPMLGQPQTLWDFNPFNGRLTDRIS